MMEPGGRTMDALLALLIVLLVMAGGSGFYVTRPGYIGTGIGLGATLYIIAAIVLIAVVLRLLGIY